MLDTIRLEDFQNNIDEYLYRVRTGKCYYLKDATTGRTWFLKPYKEPNMVTVQLDLEPQTIKFLKREAKAKKLTFDQMVTYVMLKHIDKVELHEGTLKKTTPAIKVKRSTPRKARPSLKPQKVKRSAWRK